MIPEPMNQEVVEELGRLMAKRVKDAVHSVLQLADDPRDRFVLATMGQSASAGIMAGAFCAMVGEGVDEVDPLELSILILREARDRDERS